MFLRKYCSLLTVLTIAFTIDHGNASHGTAEISGALDNGIEPTHNRDARECFDYTGRAIQNGMHFVPPGEDTCRLCICNDGNFKACRAVLCTPPPDCKSFQMGTTCCEFVCLDLPPENFFTNFKITKRQMITFALAVVATFVVISCCTCHLSRCVKYLKNVSAERGSRRNQARTATTSSMNFSEDLYVKMSVDLIAKNEEIEGLKQRVAALERQLSVRGVVPSSRDQSWKNCYDLQVAIKK